MDRLAPLALVALLLLAPIASAHENDEPSRRIDAYTEVLEDCDDDYGWHAGSNDGGDEPLWPANNELGHDLEALEMAETDETGQYLILFHLVLTQRDRPTLGGNDETTLDTLSFTVNGTPFETTIRSIDEEAFTVHAGTAPVHVSKTSVFLLPGSGDDENRFGLLLGYTYQQLGAARGTVVKDWSTIGDWEGSNPEEALHRDIGHLCHDEDAADLTEQGPIRRTEYVLEPEPPAFAVTVDPDPDSAGAGYTFTATQTDGAGNVTTWSWDFGDGTTGAGASVDHLYAEAGSYTVTLTATDELGSTNTTSVVVQNAAPDVRFSFTPDAPLLGQTIQFEDESTDDTGIASRHWDFGDGTTSSAQDPAHTYAEADVYTVALTVTDEAGNSVVSQRYIQVRADEEEPIIDFTEGPTAAFRIEGEPAAGSALRFIDESTDPDDGITSWAWDFGDGASATTRNATHTYAAPGDHDVTLTVTDAGGLQATASRTLTIDAGDDEEGPDEAVKPVAAFEYELVPGSGGLSFRFTDTSSHPAGTIVAKAWDFGDGTTAEGAEAEHAYQQFGRFTVRLIVVDEAGLKDADFQLVNVVAVDEGSNDTPLPVGAALAAVLAALALRRRARR